MDFPGRERAPTHRNRNREQGGPPLSWIYLNLSVVFFESKRSKFGGEVNEDIGNPLFCR